jgi:hypothetical protein
MSLRAVSLLLFLVRPFLVVAIVAALFLYLI